MKVLHLDTGREWRGGQQQVLHLTHGLEDRGVTSVVATPQDSPIAHRLQDEGLPVIEFPYTRHFAPRTIQAFQKVLADQQWDILHMHTSHAHTLGFLSLKMPPRKPFVKPAFVVSRRVDFVPNRDPVSRLKYTAAGQHFICVSEAIRDILFQYGIPEKQLYVVHSGVSMPESNGDGSASREALRDELGVNGNGLILGTIGNLVPHKGHQFLIGALAKVREVRQDFRAVLVGGGELESNLRSRARAAGLEEHIVFAGQIPNAARLVGAFDIYVHPSVEEGLGTSILDAGAAGIPVVATRAGGIPEAVLDGKTGLLVPPANPAALADAMLKLMEDAALRESMRGAATQWIGRSRTKENMIDQTLSVYRKIHSKH